MYISINEILDKFFKFTSRYKISFDSEIVNFKFSTKNLKDYSPYCLYIFRSNKLPNEIFNYDKINYNYEIIDFTKGDIKDVWIVKDIIISRR